MRNLFIVAGLYVSAFTTFAESNQHYEVANNEDVIANIQVRQQRDNELLITRQSVAPAAESSSMLTAMFDAQRLAKFSFRSTNEDTQVSESFSQQNKMIQWKSPRAKGQQKTKDNYLYLSPTFTPVYLAEVIKRVAQHRTQPIPVAPGGIFYYTKAQDFTVPKSKTKLTLYKVMGRSVRPDYLWLTRDLSLAAAFSRGTAYYDTAFKAVLPTLEKMQTNVEKAHWTNMSSELTHSLPDSLLIKDVTIFDAKNARFLAGQSVLIREGKIARVAPRVRVPSKTKIINGKGKTLIPGLWDMHAHIYELDALFQVASGVTNVRDKGNEAAIIERMRKMDNGELIGPRLYLSGFIDKRSDYNVSIVPPVDTLEEALAKVDDYKALGYSDIKIYGSIPIDWVKPIGDKAHRLGLTLTGHIPQGMKVSDAIKAGFNEVTHSNFLLLQFLDISEIDTRTRSRHIYAAQHGGSIRLDSQEVQDFIKLLKKHKTVVDPTLVGYTAMFTQQEGQFDPRLASSQSHLPPTVFQSFMGPQMDVSDENRMAYKASAMTLTSLIKMFIDENIPVVPGTDDLPGLVLHNELQAYHQAGVPIAKVLQMATLKSAEIAHQEDKFGSITAGKSADVVLIEGDLSKDLSLLSQASLVVKGKHYYIPSELYKAVAVKEFTSAAAGL